MIRPLVFVVFASALLALPTSAPAQKGGGGKGGPPMMQGGQKGPGGGQKGPGGPGGMQGGQKGQEKGQGGQDCEKGGPGGQAGGGMQGLNPEVVQAINQAFTSLKTLVAQLKQNQINTPAAQAVALDLQKALQVMQANTLSVQQKQEQLGQIMQQTVGDLQALANDGSLTTTQATAISNYVVQFQQMVQSAQRGQQQMAAGQGKGPPGKGPGGRK